MGCGLESITRRSRIRAYVFREEAKKCQRKGVEADRMSQIQGYKGVSSLLPSCSVSVKWFSGNMVASIRLVSVFFVALSCSWRESNGFVVPTVSQSPRCRGLPSDDSLRSRLAASSLAVSSDEELLPGIEAIDRNNPELLAKLEVLRQVPYFRLYSVDMLASCEYMPQELFECYSQTCEIYPVEDDAVCLWIEDDSL